MKNLTYLFVLVFSTQALTSEECINKYKNKFFKNKDRYERAKSRFERRREIANSHIYSAQASGSFTAASLFGVATIQNDKRPERSDYNLSGEPIIKAYDHDLSASSRRPVYLDELYNEALSVDADTTYETIQRHLKKGMQDGEFCSFFGLKDKDKITKYVLKNLAKDRTVVASDLSINNSRIHEDRQSQADKSSAQTTSFAAEQ